MSIMLYFSFGIYVCLQWVTDAPRKTPVSLNAVKDCCAGIKMEKLLHRKGLGVSAC